MREAQEQTEAAAAEDATTVDPAQAEDAQAQPATSGPVETPAAPAAAPAFVPDPDQVLSLCEFSGAQPQHVQFALTLSNGNGDQALNMLLSTPSAELEMMRSTSVGELRVDVADGRAYPLQSFLQVYGNEDGLNKWSTSEISNPIAAEVAAEVPKSEGLILIVDEKSGDTITPSQIPSGSESILRAWYGPASDVWGSGGENVTVMVKERIARQESVQASNSVFGDPAPGVVKALAVELSSCDGAAAEQAVELSNCTGSTAELQDQSTTEQLEASPPEANIERTLSGRSVDKLEVFSLFDTAPPLDAELEATILAMELAVDGMEVDGALVPISCYRPAAGRIARWSTLYEGLTVMNTVAVTCTTEEGVTVETVINTDTMEHCVVEDNITCCENLLPSFVEAQFSEGGRWTLSAGGLPGSSLTAHLTLSHCLAVAV